MYCLLPSYHTLEAGLSVNHSLGHPITLLIILFKIYLACHVSPPCQARHEGHVDHKGHEKNGGQEDKRDCTGQTSHTEK